MILYYSPGSCALAPHILLNEIGADFRAERVNMQTRTLADGTDYQTINPKGAVPSLRTDDGQVLTENAIIQQYLADAAGASTLLPPVGDFRRYRVLEWLNYIATELHKSFSPLFNPALDNETRQLIIGQIEKKFDYVEGRLGAGPFLMGDTLTLPDTYLFTVLGWAGYHKIDLARWPNLSAFRERMMQRPAVQKTLREEGLLQDQPA